MLERGDVKLQQLNEWSLLLGLLMYLLVDQQMCKIWRYTIN